MLTAFLDAIVILAQVAFGILICGAIGAILLWLATRYWRAFREWEECVLQIWDDWDD